jgi:two-component system, sensor histidine kinase
VKRLIDTRNEQINAFRVKCLLVDDLQENLTALQALLEGEPVELYSARSGVEALDLMLQHDFGLALVDVQMPSMDGFELAELMRGSERTRQTPIIFLTAGSWNRERIFKGYESGAVDFMFKPLEPRILRSKVRVFVELHRQKMRLADAEERYALSTSAAQVGTWEMNTENDEMVCSDIGLRLFGLESSSGIVRRSDLAARIHPSDRDLFEERLKLTMQTGAPLDVQFRVVQPGGSVRWIYANGKAATQGNGKISRVFGVHTDVTAEKTAADALLRAKEEADAANGLKSEFLANMSHEIRTPMTAILGFAELLLSDKLPDKARTDFVERIRSNGDHLLHLIDDILDLSKFESGQVPTEKIEFGVIDTINEALRSVNTLSTKKGIAVELEVEGAVPAKIHSDPHRLRQIIYNLVSNAIKFTSTGSVKVIVRYVAVGTGRPNQLEIAVQDTGIGIDAEKAQNLFKPFQQADSSVTRKYGGTGLGLALSRKIAEALGGDLRLVKSAPGEGSTFAVRISTGEVSGQAAAAVAETEAATEVEATPAKEIVKDALAGMNLLLVEDSVDNEALMSLYLLNAGAKIEVARNGFEAIEAATNKSFDVILMDVQMPGLDGLEATRRLRAQGYAQPIIALTAHALPEEIEKSLSAGCNSHVTKPISRANLIRAIVGAQL